jgi:ubiquinone/menaquinone biosynthesis C-methylase UbiE
LQQTSRPGQEEDAVAPLEAVREYLCVDAFMRTLVDARALKTAFELGVVDRLAGMPAVDRAALAAATGCDTAGLDLLLGMLAANGVVVMQGAGVSLHPGFRSALRFRDLLQTRLDFCGILLNDFADLFTALVRDPSAFAGNARLFQLFDYRRAQTDEGENYARTRAWMQLTSMLTRYESAACLALHDFGQHRRMLDVGGNSGEFALQACRRHPELNATILDLPLVCEIGLEHVLTQPERDRIGFMKADVRRDSLPAGYDLITFKSMLHDWPEADALQFLDRAAAAVEPGGTVLIFERLPIRIDGTAPAFSLLPILLFFRSYRDPETYAARLRERGFTDVVRREIDLDTPFAVLTARKPGGRR